MLTFDADHSDLQQALQRLRVDYLGLKERRRWYSALVCGVLVEDGQLPEWTDWSAPPPSGAPIQITPAVDAAIDALFGTDPNTVLHPSAIAALGNPKRVVIDPLRQAGRRLTKASLCVVANGRRWDIPVSDPGWLWNAGTPRTNYGASRAQIKHSNDYGAQQGILCYMSAEDLFDLGPTTADSTISTHRHNCQHWGVQTLPGRPSAKHPGAPPQQPTPSCGLNNVQCAAKGAGQKGPGGPRALIPDTLNSAKRLLAPGSFDRILEDANPDNNPLPSRGAMALVVDFYAKGHGYALNANRLLQLISPRHLAMLFSP